MFQQILSILLLLQAVWKRKESSYGVDRFKHTTSAYLGRRTTVNGVGTEWNWSGLWFHPVVDTALFFFLQPSGSFCLPTDSAFPIWLLSGVQDGWWGIPHLTEATTQAFARRARTQPWEAGSAQDPASLWPPAHKWQPTAGGTIKEDFLSTLPHAQ